MLFNIIMGLFLLFMITMMMVNPEAKNAEIELKAEFVVTMTWPDESKDDVDLFVKLPNGLVVSFNNKDHSFAALDRDDQGQRTDMVTLPGGETVVIKENYEHVTVRKLMAGKYVVNTIMWTKIDPKPTKVNVKIEQLNPYRLIHNKQIVLTTVKQEETAARFFVNNGKVKDVDSISESVLPRGRMDEGE
jgi:hypothetical protein